MQIVIDISDKLYEYIEKGRDLSDEQNDTIAYAIVDGTPLPKGHGRLIDADRLKREYPHDTDREYPVNTNQYAVDTIDNVPTVIEADREDNRKDEL